MLYTNVGTVLALSGDGTGPGIVGTLPVGSFTGGTRVRLAGINSVRLRVHVAFVNATAIGIQVLDDSSSSDASFGPAPLLNVRQSSGAVLSTQIYLPATGNPADDVLEIVLGGAVERIRVQAQAQGMGLTAGDLVKVELSFSEGSD